MPLFTSHSYPSFPFQLPSPKFNPLCTPRRLLKRPACPCHRRGTLSPFPRQAAASAVPTSPLPASKLQPASVPACVYLPCCPLVSPSHRTPPPHTNTRTYPFPPSLHLFVCFFEALPPSRCPPCPPVFLCQAQRCLEQKRDIRPVAQPCPLQLSYCLVPACITPPRASVRRPPVTWPPAAAAAAACRPAGRAQASQFLPPNRDCKCSVPIRSA